MVQIIEIIGRSSQGQTRPYICRGDDDNTYFVKGVGTTRRGQVYEWISGNLGLACGLPIAPFKIVDVPEELVENNPDYNDLGVGPAFGSLKQRIMELNYAGIVQVPDELQRAVLAFDWWVNNQDRLLTEKGGNPNLFWEPEHEKLVVFDHNLAFDTDFSKDIFLENHVFSQIINNLFSVRFYRDALSDQFKNALAHWKNICDNIPLEWNFIDKEMTISADIQLNDIFNILNRCNSPDFWNQT